MLVYKDKWVAYLALKSKQLQYCKMSYVLLGSRSNTIIETDETAKNPASIPTLNFNNTVDYLRNLITKESLTVTPQEFQKDDEESGHMDFIMSTSNLRAIMYGIEPKEKDEIRKLAGRIIPAIITTTSVVAALLVIELLKVLKKSSREVYRNCFMNLALASFIFAEPAPAPIHSLSNGLRYTLWDKLEVHGHVDFTVKDFITELQNRYGGLIDTIIQGTKIVYMSFIPIYRLSLDKKMADVLTLPTGASAVDLFVDSGDSGTGPNPPIRYFLQ